jgi:hypothetical protein
MEGELGNEGEVGRAGDEEEKEDFDDAAMFLEEGFHCPRL